MPFHKYRHYLLLKKSTVRLPYIHHEHMKVLTTRDMTQQHLVEFV